MCFMRGGHELGMLHAYGTERRCHAQLTCISKRISHNYPMKGTMCNTKPFNLYSTATIMANEGPVSTTLP